MVCYHIIIIITLLDFRISGKQWEGEMRIRNPTR
jgi:hypothetical protein